MKNVAIIGTVGVPANYCGFETLAENLVRYHYTVSLPEPDEPEQNVGRALPDMVGRFDRLRTGIAHPAVTALPHGKSHSARRIKPVLSLIELLAIRLSWQTTPAKSLVMSKGCRAGYGLFYFLNGNGIIYDYGGQNQKFLW